MAILCFFCVLLRILAVTEQFRPEGIKKRRMDGQTGSSDAPPAGTKKGGTDLKHEMQRESVKSEKIEKNEKSGKIEKIEKAGRSGRISGVKSDAAENSAVRDDIDAYDYLGGSCSATDCTGLMPAPPRNRAEREAYEELYPYQSAAQPKD